MLHVHGAIAIDLAAVDQRIVGEPGMVGANALGEALI
jgi:hypothetical protein